MATNLLAVGSLLLAFALYFRPFLFGGVYLFDADAVGFYYPWKPFLSDGSLNRLISLDSVREVVPWQVFLAKSLEEDFRVPLWNPYELFGVPFLGSGAKGSFALTNLWYLVFSPARALTFKSLTILIGSSLFAYVYLRHACGKVLPALLGASLFLLSSFGLSVSYFYVSNDDWLWWPLALFLVDRSLTFRSLAYPLGLGLTLSAMILGGVETHSLLLTGLVVLYGLFQTLKRRGSLSEFKRSLRGIALACAVGVLLSGVKFLPLVSVYRLSTRSGDPTLTMMAVSGTPRQGGDGGERISWARALEGGLSAGKETIYSLINLIFPFSDSATIMSRQRGHNHFFIGFLPLILCAVAWRRRRCDPRMGFFPVIMVASVLIMALGKIVGGFLTALLHWDPEFSLWTSLFRADRISSWLAASAPMGAGLGLTALVKNPEEAGGVRCIVAGVGGIYILGAAAAHVLGWDSLFLNFDVPRSLAWIGAGGSLLFLFGSFPRKAGPLALAIVVAATANLAVQNKALVRSHPEDHFYPETDAISFLKANLQPGQFRFLAMTHFSEGLTYFTPLMEPNMALVFRLEDAGGKEALLPRRHALFLGRIQHSGPKEKLQPPSRMVNFSETVVRSPLLGLMNVKYVVTTGDREFFYNEVYFDPDRFGVVYSGEVVIYEDRQVLPRAFVVGRAVSARDEEEAFEMVFDPGFDPKRAVILEGWRGSEGEREEQSWAGVARITRYAREEVDIRVEMSEKGFLVLTDSYFPGWKAWVDGSPAEIYRANYLFRAVPLSEGVHHVTFRYEPWEVKVGAWMSGLVFLFCLAGIVASGARHPKDKQ